MSNSCKKNQNSIAKKACCHIHKAFKASHSFKSLFLSSNTSAR